MVHLLNLYTEYQWGTPM